jgi:hypothetical protein
VVLLAEDAEVRKRTETLLAELAWSDRFIGQFVYVAAGSTKELAVVRGLEAGTGVVVIQPDKYGREGKVLAQAPVSTQRSRIEELLRDGLAAHKPDAKAFPAHIRAGREVGVFWETVIPVTDPMEQRARER